METEKIEINWEGMGYVPRTVFEQISGQGLPHGFRENLEIKGTEWDEDGDDLKMMFPALWSKYTSSFEE